MRDLVGRTAIVTGGSRGLGVYVARALAREGMQIVLAARSAADLDAVKAELTGRGAKVLTVPVDLMDRQALPAVVEASEREFGAVDVLVNNAGIEVVYSYHKLEPKDIDESIQVNLAAAMHLTRQVLPGMLERRRGQIVNMASLAGKAGPAFSEPYAATKAALIGFTQSLRASYEGTGVSASVICPGFVGGAGMYARMSAETGLHAPSSLGVSKPEAVGAAVVRAIREDLAEVIVNPRPVRPLLAVAALSPKLGERIVKLMGTRELFRSGAAFRERQQTSA